MRLPPVRLAPCAASGDRPGQPDPAEDKAHRERFTPFYPCAFTGKGRKRPKGGIYRMSGADAADILTRKIPGAARLRGPYDDLRECW